MRWTRTFAIVVAAAVVTGCASNAPVAVLREGPRMIELYRGTTPATAAGHAAGRQGTPAQRRCGWWRFTWPCRAVEREPAAAAAPEPSYARTAADELRLLFPRLPNPDIYIYVPPHLATEERLPVPGYTTAVPLYEGVEYALPGEAAPAPADGAREAAP